jgi:hypothetical protein
MTAYRRDLVRHLGHKPPETIAPRSGSLYGQGGEFRIHRAEINT